MSSVGCRGELLEGSFRRFEAVSGERDRFFRHVRDPHAIPALDFAEVMQELRRIERVVQSTVIDLRPPATNQRKRKQKMREDEMKGSLTVNASAALRGMTATGGSALTRRSHMGT